MNCASYARVFSEVVHQSSVWESVTTTKLIWRNVFGRSKVNAKNFNKSRSHISASQPNEVELLAARVAEHLQRMGAVI